MLNDFHLQFHRLDIRIFLQFVQAIPNGIPNVQGLLPPAAPRVQYIIALKA